jgi:DNA-binding protein HU-beta
MVCCFINELEGVPMAAKTITKTAIIAKIADDAELTKAQAKAALASLVAQAYKGAKSPNGFTVPGLGKLIKVRRKARMGRNPATGESIKIKAKTTLKFRIAKAAKDAVVPPKA